LDAEAEAEAAAAAEAEAENEIEGDEPDVVAGTETEKIASATEDEPDNLLENAARDAMDVEKEGEAGSGELPADEDNGAEDGDEVPR
jgi:hypothetical protein